MPRTREERSTVATDLGAVEQMLQLSPLAKQFSYGLSLRIYACIPDCVLQTRVQSAVRLVGLAPSAEAAATSIGGRSRQAGYALSSPTTRMAHVPGATAD